MDDLRRLLCLSLDRRSKRVVVQARAMPDAVDPYLEERHRTLAGRVRAFGVVQILTSPVLALR